MRTPKTARHHYLSQTLPNDKSVLYDIKVICSKLRTFSLLRRYLQSSCRRKVSSARAYNSSSRGRPRGGLPSWVAVCAMFFLQRRFTLSHFFTPNLFVPIAAGTCLRCWYVPPTVHTSLGRFTSRPQTAVVLNSSSSCSRGARGFG